MSKKFNATLMQGATYTQIVPKEGTRDVEVHTFERDVPKVISEELKALLEEGAVEEVSVTMGTDTSTETRQKFAFTEVAAAPARTRPAPAAQ